MFIVAAPYSCPEWFSAFLSLSAAGKNDFQTGLNIDQAIGDPQQFKVVNVEGGTAAWEAAGLPVVRGKKTISLERQVRIAAGVLVLVGSALGYFVHPYFIGVAAFVGAGLTFAGVTDTCGMGMLLARMPWNQVSQASGDAACCEGS